MRGSGGRHDSGVAKLAEVTRPRTSRGVSALARRCGDPRCDARRPRSRLRQGRRASSPSCAARSRPSRASTCEVSGGDRFLLLRNGTGKQVIVKGYEDEPYLRFLPNRVVEENPRVPVQVRERGPLRAHAASAPGELRGDAQMAAVSRNGSLPVVRPPHPLDGEGHAAAGEGRGRAHQDLRLARPDDGRRCAGRTRSARSSGYRRISSGSSTGLIVGAAAAAILRDRQLGFLLGRRRRPRAATGRPVTPSGRAARRWTKHGEALRPPSRRSLLCARDRPRGRDGPRRAGEHGAAVGLDLEAAGRPGRVPLQRAGRGQLRRDPRVRPRRARASTTGEVFHPGGRGPELGVQPQAGAPQGQLHRDVPRDLGGQPPGRPGASCSATGRRPPTGASVSQLLSQQGNAGDVSPTSRSASRAGDAVRRRSRSRSERSSSCSSIWLRALARSRGRRRRSGARRRSASRSGCAYRAADRDRDRPR